MKNTLTGMLMTLALSTGTAGEPGVDPAPRYTSPAYRTMPTLMWPGDVDREALVYLRVTISTEGKVTHIEVDDRGFHERRFVDAAIVALKSARFRPATLDGKAVVATVVAPITFKLGGPDGDQSKWAVGITDEFRTELKKVENLLQQHDYAGAHFHSEFMLREKVKTGYEYAVLKAELAQTQALVGRDQEALRAAAEATQKTTMSFQKFSLHQPVPPNSPSNYLLPKQIVINLLGLRMRLAARQGLLLESLQAYYELAGLVPMAPDEPLVLEAAKLTARLESKGLLVAQGLVSDGELWGHALFRRNFTVRKVEGNINSLKLLCGAGHQEMQYAPGEEWSVPSGWEDCDIAVSGEDGTTFEFVELADETPAATTPP